MPHDSIVPRVHWLLAAALLLLCLTLGGGQGTLGDTACQMTALVLIGLTLWRHTRDREAQLPRIAWIVALPFLLPLLQLLPVPDALWQVARARGTIGAAMVEVGVVRGSAFSLAPAATERAALWLLPAAATFLATFQISKSRRVGLFALVAAIACASVVLGFGQVAAGVDSSLRPYTITNSTEAVGFFANRNHYAILLVVCVPLTVVALVKAIHHETGGDSAHRVIGVVAAIAGVALLIIGIAIARSRAGVLLGAFALVLSLPVAWRVRAGAGTRRAISAAIAVGTVAAIHFAFYRLSGRFVKEPLEDARLQYISAAYKLAEEHNWAGTGIGGFKKAFEPMDPTPSMQYVNHAHNDYAELLVEGGAITILCVGVFFTFLIAQFLRKRALRRAPESISSVSAIGMSILLLHSAIDYPLRTTALLTTMALFLANWVQTAPSRANLLQRR